MTTALRRLLRAPLFTAGAVLTLGLGLGAAAAVVEVADTLWLRALPFPEPERMVRLFVTPPGAARTLSLRPETFAALRERTGHLFEEVVGQRLTTRTLQGPDGAVQVDTIGVTEGWAELLGLRPQLGRLFSADEVAAGEESEAVVLADSAWRTQFGADEAVVGRKLVIDGAPRTVVGVLPRGYVFPYEADLWHPTRADRPSASPWSFHAPARLRAGVTLEAANAALATLAPELEKLLPERQRGFVPHARPLREILLDDRDGGARAAGVVVALLVALVAVNLAALFHARWLAARRELALRAALGGGRAAIARALAAEGAVVALSGLALGALVARLARPFLAAQLPGRLVDVGAAIEPSGRTVSVTVATALALFVLTALVPAWRAARVDPFRLLRGDAGAGGGRDVRRATRALVALQIGLALALGAASLALASDLRARAELDLGYDAERVAIASASLTSSAYAEPDSRLRFVDETIRRFEALPGVEAASALHLFPSDRGSFLALLESPDRPSAVEDRFQVQNRLASPELARVLGLKLVEGRWLSERDRAGGPPVAVISESVARRFFPEGGAVGGRLRNSREGAAGAAIEVVGVVAEVHEFAETNAAWYRPIAQQAGETSLALVQLAVRTAPGAAPPSERVLRDAVAAVDPTVALFDYAPARELLTETFVAQRDAASASAALALFGLALAALGLFVRIAEAVVRRRRELGVRMALGATRTAVVRALVREGALLAAAGLVPGALLAWALQRLVARQLDAPALADDPLPLAIAAAITAASTLAAAWLAGRRAAGIDPARELRAE
jgi:predicted permease